MLDTIETLVDLGLIACAIYIIYWLYFYLLSKPIPRRLIPFLKKICHVAFPSWQIFVPTKKKPG